MKMFLNYLWKNYKSLSEQEKEKYCFFLDNLSSHSTTGLFTLYKEKKMKIIFNCPYRRNFNMVELFFRHIKRETYTHLYSNIESVTKDINNIFDGENIKKSLKHFYRRTLEEYLNYINKNFIFNLN